MRNRLRYFRPILDYLGVLVGVFGLLMLVPLAVWAVYAWRGEAEVPSYTYWIPALIAVVLAVAMKRDWEFPPLDTRRAMMLCALGWIVVSAVGALPFVLGLGANYLDAYFETVSGFTTTGITMFTGLDEMPRSMLFWRGFTQWLGGLGILTFFLAVIFTGGSAHRLYSAESHKIFSRRLAPGLLHTLRILWTIYAIFTALTIAALWLEGVSLFDAVAHAMTALSTGGYSPYDASIGHYAATGHPNFRLIEYTLTVAMLLGGINFVVHWQWLHGRGRSLGDNLEMRLWWLLLAIATGLVMLDHYLAAGRGISGGLARLEEVFRHSVFQVVAILTTTGFSTENIGGAYFGAIAAQVFLVLMVVGGCVGSTSGGVKVLRVGILWKMLTRQIRRHTYGPDAVNPVVVDGEIVPAEELRRVASLFFGWMVLLLVGALATALLSDHDALSAASGMFSALGNIGPCYISVEGMTELHPVVKIVYILGMLAGRLEILPLLLLFSRRTWR